MQGSQTWIAAFTKSKKSFFSYLTVIYFVIVSLFVD